MDPIPREVLRKFIEHWGTDPQIDMLDEECKELGLAISKARRFGLDTIDPETGRSWRNRIQEEIADTIIMAEQVAEILGYEDVAEFKILKLARTKKRLGKDRGIKK